MYTHQTIECQNETTDPEEIVKELPSSIPADEIIEEEDEDEDEEEDSFDDEDDEDEDELDENDQPK
jgi:hypothetical protein